MRNTTLCHLERDDQYLMLHRVKKAVDENKDKWVGIGGKFLEGESPEDCLLREVREETGLTLLSWRFRGIVTFVSDQWGTEYMHLFTSDAWEGSLRTDCEEGELAWIGKDELLEKINAALAELKEEGFMEELAAKYFASEEAAE